jgi:hypothetical protein
VTVKTTLVCNRCGRNPSPREVKNGDPGYLPDYHWLKVVISYNFFDPNDQTERITERLDFCHECRRTIQPYLYKKAVKKTKGNGSLGKER